MHTHGKGRNKSLFFDRWDDCLLRKSYVIHNKSPKTNNSVWQECRMQSQHTKINYIYITNEQLKTEKFKNTILY